MKHIILAAALAALALATPAQSHDWYSGIQVPGTTRSCCSDRDCQPVDWRQGDSPWGEVEVNGEWYPVEEAKIVRNIGSPDGEHHACFYMARKPGTGPSGPSVPIFRCFINPSGA